MIPKKPVPDAIRGRWIAIFGKIMLHQYAKAG
jgi:hypothetical protein